MDKIIAKAIDNTLGTLFNWKKFTTGNKKTESRHAKAKGIKMFWATLIK